MELTALLLQFLLTLIPIPREETSFNQLHLRNEGHVMLSAEELMCLNCGVGEDS